MRTNYSNRRQALGIGTVKQESTPNFNRLLLGGIVGAVEPTVLSALTACFVLFVGLKALFIFVSALLFPIGAWFGVAVTWAATSRHSSEQTAKN